MALTRPTRAPDPAATERALLRTALAMVGDPAEARELVATTMASAGGARLSEVQLFGLLRRTYHSIERTRRRRPMRDALVTALAREPARRGG